MARKQDHYAKSAQTQVMGALGEFHLVTDWSFFGEDKLKAL